MTFENIRLAILELFTRRKASLEQQIPSATGEALQAMQKELARLNALLPNTAWQPDPAWLAGLPSLLCGPIVRKVQPDEVTVWVMLKAQATVVLTIFERKADGQKGSAIFSGSLGTVRVGEHLHVAAVRAKPDSPTSPNKLLRGNTYYYDLAWGGESLGAHRADLVYGDKDPLPSFVVAPLDLNDLRIFHGSCRNVTGSGFDATPNLDHVIGKAWDDTAKNWNATRPHQLFLTGDQIYADEGNDTLLNLVGEAGSALLAGFQASAFNWEEELPIRDDLVMVDLANRKKPDDAPTGGFKNPSKLYPGLRTVRGGELCLGFKDGADELQPFDLLSEGMKLTAKTSNHVFGLGEFFASYLFVWSDKVWPGIFQEPKFAEEFAQLKTVFDDAAKKKKDPSDKRDKSVRTAEAVFGKDFFKNLSDADFRKHAARFHLSVSDASEKREAAREEAVKQIATGYVKLVESLFKFTIFAQGVAKVRRGLANVSTYMMFDDHELSDDWHMTRDWVKEVYGNPAGIRVLQNGLCAYAIFQAWGNTPERFEGDENGKKFLNALADWIQAKMPVGAKSDAVLERVIPCKLLPDGKKEIPLQKDGALVGSEKVIRWDYALSFGKYEAIVTDARTRRSFTRRELAAAEHLSKDAVKSQAPDAQGAEFDPEFTLLVSPCNVLTIPDFRKGIAGTGIPLKVEVSNILKMRSGATIQKAAVFNYDPDFADSWFVAEEPFERLVARLAARMPKKENARLPARVIVLSGDVHFSAASRMQYWADKAFNEAEGVANLVMAHLVSSGFKNEAGIWYFLHHAGFEALDLVDDEKRLPKTEVLAGYAKKVDDLTPEELAKRKELIDKTRWFPNYRPTMFAPAEGTAPSLLPYHQTDPAVKIPKPDWFYRIDHMRGKKPKTPDPNDPKLHKFENIVAGGFDATIQKMMKNQIEHFKYGKNFAAGLEVIALNSIAEVTFAWEGTGKLADALTVDTDKFVIKVEKAFPRVPFHIIVGSEIVQVSKTESFGTDLRVTECKRGAVKTTKAAHAKDASVVVRKMVSQTHWVAKAKKEDTLPAGIADVECAQFTRFDITMELEDLEFPKPVLNV
jgi:hypothetical protein